MDDVIKNLTPEQALAVLMRLSGKESGIRDAVLAEAQNVLSEVDPDDVAEDVYFVLDSIDVHDCWDKAGSSRDGYTSPEEAAVELIEEELQPYFDQLGRYRELGMTKQEHAYCKGVILGIYRYEQESKSEFRDWSIDIPVDCAGSLLDEWRERCQNSRSKAAMDDFIRERCPKWAKYLIRTGGKV
jgi:hypothetical protein